MRVCIIRNAEAKSNAGIIRIMDALIDIEAKPITLTRSRFSKKKNGKFLYKPFRYKDQLISNYELQFKTDMGRGIRNIFQLILYQISTIFWLLKNKKKYDALHAFDLDAGVPALICAKLTRKKFVYHIADFYIDSRHGIPSSLRNFVRKLEYSIISKADTTIICTEERKEQIKNSKPKKLYVVHNSPVDQHQQGNKLYNKKDIDNGLLTLGYVGGLFETRFIKQVINFVKNNSDVRLNIAGLGPLEHLVKEAAESHHNIRYYGRISYDEALDLYSQCDVMFAMYDPAIPNHRYSAPNKVYEAMMLGLPIIVARGTGIDTLVDSEKIGFSIDYSEEVFTSTIAYILTHKKLMKQFESNSQCAYEKYSWEKMKQRVQDIYFDLSN